jgi:hypothetical protein
VRIRNHRWYDSRLDEIPERLLNAWEARFRATRQCSLDDLAAISQALSDRQLDRFPIEIGTRGIIITGRFGPYISATTAMLRAYASLTPRQRQALNAGEEVPYAALAAPDA